MGGCVAIPRAGAFSSGPRNLHFRFLSHATSRPCHPERSINGASLFAVILSERNSRGPQVDGESSLGDQSKDPS
jgi:hypothetical protein